MSKKIKLQGLSMKNALDFKNLPLTRDEIINNTPLKEVDGKFAINENAKALHPDKQDLVILDIIEHCDAKTFIIGNADGKSVAYFRAGQYLSVSMKFEGSILTRPYSISSSPKWAKEGKYAVTIRRNPNGYAADKALDNFKVGDAVTVSAPEGNFYYEELRDAKDVIALAGGSGITPFLSMAYAIRDGIEDFNLTIIFGSRNYDSILFRDELDAIASECSKVKVVHVLSDEEKEGFEKGFITADIIKKYAPEGVYSIFMCGPEAMYRFADGEIAKLGLERKYVRKELQSVTKNVASLPGYPAEAEGKTFKCKLVRGEEVYEFDARSDEPVLVAIERAGIQAPSRCRCGECGWCRSKLLKGDVYIPESTDGRRWADKENGYIHPCASFPVSDLEIEVPGYYY